ncbi:efflux RND transporter periplasmic adaptor subunit [Pontiella agarivorans]|uniref:Efflux RND transporter periplasmic adaptor subunit n=1 Tax=Pontiella agarivorans TaxID=3038953 RepID=A0ABU5MYJ5_9BACT|nr:efflux RND transporter periplasmic adaptor subunit [Pontiella agarivorans]MDZ8119255.1 efflux RND transporter periplasmic adaptor subunit [Pontiella agarivorans]
MNKLFIFSGLSVFFLIGCTPKNEFQPPPAPEVGVQTPVVRDVTVYDSFPGRAAASDEVDIRARVTGFLKSIDFEDGQRVNKGDLLFTIEPEQYESAVNSAKAQLAQAQAALKLAEATLQRNQNAYKTKAVSEVDVLTAEANKDSAAAAVMEAEAGLEKAMLDLSYTKIHAPFSGRVARRSLSVGNLVGSGTSTLLTTVVVEAPIDVFFNVDERTLMPFLREGRGTTEDKKKMPPVKLELADGIQHTEEGIVDYSDPEIDPDTGTLRLRAEFPNAKINLIPGMYGNILLPKKIEKAVLVPDLAIQRDLSGAFVLVVNDENIVESRYIQRGALVGTERIVSDGLNVDERVIVNGLQRARPGIPVRIAEPQPQPAAEKEAAPAAE